MGFRGPMRDTCQVGTGVASTTVEPTASSYTWATAIRCRFHEGLTTEVRNGSEATVTEAVFLLPAGTVITSANRIRLTKRNGTTLSTARIFAIVGEPISSGFGLGYKSTVGLVLCKARELPGSFAI